MNGFDKHIQYCLHNNGRHVTFSDQSESGYSTTTSSDEGRTKRGSKMATGGHYHGPHELNTTFPPWQRPQNEARPMDPSHIDKLYRYHNKNSPTVLTDPLGPGSFGPSASSPVYYDPLHLRNLGQVEQPLNPVEDPRIFDVKAERVDPSQWTKRGILKNNLSHSEQNLPTTGNSIHTVYPVYGAANFPQTTPSRLSSNSSTPPHSHNPVHVRPFNPAESNGSPMTSLQDPQRKSAFTPVASRKQITGSTGDLTSFGFSPVKAPPVLDFVTSSVAPSNHFVERSHPVLRLHQHQADDGQRGVSANPVSLPAATLPQYHTTPPVSAPKHHPTPPVPAPRRNAVNLPQNFNSLSIESGSVTESLILSGSVTESRTSNSCSSGSPSSQVEALTNEAVRLRHFLDRASAKDLKRFLRDQLESKNPKVIKALSTLVPMSVAKQIESHCVRCHKDFNPNERSRCYLPHPESMVVKVNQDESGADFVCHCCSTGFRLLKMDFYEETTNALLTGHCYSGQHTTDRESVDFRVDRGAAKSCEENGCVEFYV